MSMVVRPSRRPVRPGDFSMFWNIPGLPIVPEQRTRKGSPDSHLPAKASPAVGGEFRVQFYTKAIFGSGLHRDGQLLKVPRLLGS